MKYIENANDFTLVADEGMVITNYCDEMPAYMFEYSYKVNVCDLVSNDYREIPFSEASELEIAKIKAEKERIESAQSGVTLTKIEEEI